MGFIEPDTIQGIAHSVNTPQLSDAAARELAPDVEYRLREVVQVHAADSLFPPRQFPIPLGLSGGVEVCTAREAGQTHNR
jgi:hypothetical protein